MHWRGWVRVLSIALAGVGLGGCAGSNSQPQPKGVIASAAHKALARWKDFPIADHPRAIILRGGRVQRPLNRAQPHTNLLVERGSYHLDLRLPAGPARVHGYRLISADDAAHRLRILKPARAARVPRLRVEEVRLGTGHFPTDRPDTRYPAWLFSIKHVQRPTRVLAARVYHAPKPLRHRLTGNPLGTVAISADHGRRLDIVFLGTRAGNAPCEAGYTAQSFSSNTAVAVAIVAHRSSTSRSGRRTICSLVGYTRRVVAHLPEPLGNRVLLNVSDAEPIPVVTDSTDPFDPTLQPCPIVCRRP